MQRQLQRSIEARKQRLANARDAPIAINVYVTINRNGALGDVANGDITAAAVAQQIAVLNANYAGAQISFVLAGNVTRIRNPDLWNVDVGTSAKFRAAITPVHQGTYADLNLVTTGMLDNILGCVAARAF